MSRSARMVGSRICFTMRARKGRRRIAIVPRGASRSAASARRAVMSPCRVFVAPGPEVATACSGDHTSSSLDGEDHSTPLRGSDSPTPCPPRSGVSAACHVWRPLDITRQLSPIGMKREKTALQSPADVALDVPRIVVLHRSGSEPAGVQSPSRLAVRSSWRGRASAGQGGSK